MIKDGRALTEKDLQALQRDFFNGIPDDRELARLFETVHVQRRVLRELLKLFYRENPLSNNYVTDAVRHSTLAHFKELVCLEDER